jgi:hypothetical protein
MEMRSIKKIYNFRWASVAGVPSVAKVANNLGSWLRWMVNSYVDHLDTKMTYSRTVCLSTLALQYLGMFTVLPT